MSGKTTAAGPIVIANSDTFKVGQSTTSTEVIDDKMVRAYADVTGDHNPIHLDEAFAEKTKFHHRIARGGILFGLASKVLGDPPTAGSPGHEDTPHVSIRIRDHHFRHSR
jgi:acyl dehydratase